MNDEVELKLGKGLISGYLSAVLGILALIGVICFHFPELFTSEEFRGVYTVEFARATLLIVLVFSFFAGIVSYVLSETKKLAWIGIGTSLAASVLGGAQIEVRAFESTPYSFGLDWFAFSLLFTMLIFIPLERAFARDKEQKIMRTGWRTDLAYFFVSHLAIQFILLFINSFSEILFGWAVNAQFQSVIRSIPIVLQFAAAVFLADLFQYGIHRIHHLVPFLWRFHAIHHSSPAMDWLAGSRIHFFEVLIVRAIVMLPLYLCGFSETALNAYVILVGIQSVAIHANMGINFGFLRYMVVTPQYHHWHHAKDTEYVDANYAVHLPIIDMIFGTYRCPKGEWPKEYGVVSDEPPRTFWRQFVYPFQS